MLQPALFRRPAAPLPLSYPLRDRLGLTVMGTLHVTARFVPVAAVSGAPPAPPAHLSQTAAARRARALSLAAALRMPPLRIMSGCVE